MRTRAKTSVIALAALLVITQVGALTAEAAGMMMFFANITLPDQRLLHPGGAAWDQFGKSVAISGDTIVAAAAGDDTTAANDGSAFVYKFNGSSWVLEAHLKASDAAANDQFGSAVAIAGDTVVVGAFADGSADWGSAYIFERTGSAWTQKRKLTVNGLPDNARLGFSVAASQNYVAIAAVGNATVYVFKRDAGGAGGWSNLPVATLPGGGSLFGENVSMSGDLLAITARLVGRVFIYDAAINFGRVKTINGPAAEAFGRSVAIGGDALIVGAPGADTGADPVNHGAAYIYQRDFPSAGAWGFVKKVIPSEVPNLGTRNDQMGVSVAIAGDMAVAGAFTDDPYGTDSGSAYVFQRDAGGANNWGETDKLIPDTTGGAQHWFGRAVATSGAAVVVGAPMFANAGVAAPLPGSAYVYEFGPPPPPPTIPNAPTGLAATNVASGQNDVTWTDNSSDESAFWLYHKEQVGGSAWDLIAQLPADTVSYSDTGLNASSAYCYRVMARNSAGPSSFSNIGCATLIVAASTPSDPSNLSASPVSDSRIDLSWTDNSTGETGFRVFAKEQVSGGTWRFVADVAADSTAYSHTGLSSGTGYCYRVLARNGALSSAYSNISCTTTAGVSILLTPSGLSATGVSNTRIDLSWVDNSNNETLFRVFRKIQVPGGTWVFAGNAAANSTAYADTGLQVGTGYCYRVLARNSAGTSTYSNIACTTTTGASAPATPSGLNATSASTTQINLAWTDNSNNETAFRVYRKIQTIGGRWVFAADVAANSTAYSDTGLAGATGYCYRIAARNGGLSSSYSNISCSTTQ